jgi:hypothetical protein
MTTVQKFPKKQWTDILDSIDASAIVSEDAEDDLIHLQDEQDVIADENKIQCAIKMKLSTFCKHEGLKKKLDSITLQMNQLVAEAYEFANFHLLRLLELPNCTIPVIGREFYYRCILAVTVNNCREETLDDEFRESIAQFDALRLCEKKKFQKAPEGLKAVVKKPYFVSKIRITTTTYQIISSLSITMATMATNHLIVNMENRLKNYIKWKYPTLKCLKDKIIEGIFFPKKSVDSLFKKVKKATPLKIEQAKTIVRELRLFGELTHKPKFASKAHLTLKLYYKMLKEAELFNEANQEGGLRKKAKMFTLLPTKSGFTISNIPISNLAFINILKETKLENNLKGYGTCQDHRRLWSKYFNLNGIETKTHKFNNYIITDGYAVSAILCKSSSIVCSCESDGFKELKHLYREWCDNDNNKNFIDMKGADPGFTDIVTTASIGGNIESYSSAKYYENSKVFLSQRRTNKWNKETESIIRAISTGQTAKFENYKTHARDLLTYLPILLKHRAERGYRSFRFLRFVYKKKTINEICDMIAPRDKVTIVGFGDWGGGNGTPISRRCAGPLQEIKMELKRRDNVFLRSINEKRTSVTCHNCNCRLSNMRADSVKVKRDGTHELKQNSKIHKVLHCKNSHNGTIHCGTTWNRDVNASKNILMLLMLNVLGLPRPEAF